MRMAGVAVMAVALVGVSVAVVVAPPAPADAGPTAAGPHLVPVAPTRALDTRETRSRLGVRQPRRLPLSPPAGAEAVALNVTAVGATGAGFVAVHPCDVEPGATSTLNFAGPAAVANAVPMALLAGAGTCVSASSPVDVVVDVSGWWLPGPGPALQPHNPMRILDSRTGGAPRRPGGVPVPLPLPPAPAVAVTVVLVDPVADAWAAVHPCAQPPGGTSTVNAVAHGIAANLAVVAADAPVCVTSSVAAHLVVDLVAVAADPGPDVPVPAPVAPRRLLDTRADGPAWVGGGGTVELDLGAGPAAALLDVVAVDPFDAGYVTVWPCAQPVPLASALSWARPATVAGAIVVGAPDGRICLRPDVGAHLVVDLLGVDPGHTRAPTVTIAGRTDTWTLGTSLEGRPITARAVGTWGGPVALAVAGIHGDEPGGVPIARAVAAAPPPGVLTWVVEAANPDGLAAARRTNARGVDLNRNFPVGWTPGTDAEGDHGPVPLSEPESAALAGLLHVARPLVAVWWHQVGDWVDTGSSVARPELRARYAAVAGVGLAVVPCDDGCTGTATTYGNATIAGSTQFVVELPDALDGAAVSRHVAAFAAIAGG